MDYSINNRSITFIALILLGVIILIKICGLFVGYFLLEIEQFVKMLFYIIVIIQIIANGSILDNKYYRVIFPTLYLIPIISNYFLSLETEQSFAWLIGISFFSNLIIIFLYSIRYLKKGLRSLLDHLKILWVITMFAYIPIDSTLKIMHWPRFEYAGEVEIFIFLSMAGVFYFNGIKSGLLLQKN